MDGIEAMSAPIAAILDKIIVDPKTREEAQSKWRELIAGRPVGGIGLRPAALISESPSVDRWTSRARPSFLYVMYALLLWSIPMGLIAAVRPDLATAIARGMTAYLNGLPEPLYTLFGTGYLGYTVARQWGKAKGTDR